MKEFLNCVSLVIILSSLFACTSSIQKNDITIPINESSILSFIIDKKAAFTLYTTMSNIIREDMKCNDIKINSNIIEIPSKIVVTEKDIITNTSSPFKESWVVNGCNRFDEFIIEYDFRKDNIIWRINKIEKKEDLNL